MRIRPNTPLILLAAIGCASGDPAATAGPPGGGSQQVAGSYLLSTINGLAIPAQQTATVRVDSGGANLWPSGYYEIYVRRFVNNSPENFISQSGHWTFANGTVQFIRNVGNTAGTVASDGHIAVSVLVGEPQALVFRRIGDAPAPPVAYFNGDPDPSLSAGMTTQGSGGAMTISASIVVRNPDVIGRVITFRSSCPAALWLATDSVAFTNAAWTDWQDASICAPRELTDTISPGAQKTFTDTRRVSDMRTLSGGLLPAGRYYAWLVSDVEFPAQTFKGRLGWVTLAPASP